LEDVVIGSIRRNYQVVFLIDLFDSSRVEENRLTEDISWINPNAEVRNKRIHFAYGAASAGFRSAS
jgi:hypothetical protein